MSDKIDTANDQLVGANGYGEVIFDLSKELGGVREQLGNAKALAAVAREERDAVYAKCKADVEHANAERDEALAAVDGLQQQLSNARAELDAYEAAEAAHDVRLP